MTADRTREPSHSRRQDAVIIAVAALAMVGTLPGRTQGLGLVTEPLLADLGLDRVTYAAVNFWATIVGAAGALGIGGAIDRAGPRIVLTAIAVALVVVVLAMSAVTSIAGLALSLTLTRAVGQSALSVVSIAMVGRWFVRRVDCAMAVYSILLSIGFMAAFPAVGALVQQFGWRVAWAAIGIALLVLLAPVAARAIGPCPSARRPAWTPAAGDRDARGSATGTARWNGWNTPTASTRSGWRCGAGSIRASTSCAGTAAFRIW